MKTFPTTIVLGRVLVTHAAVLAFLLVTCSVARPNAAFAAQQRDAIKPADTSSPRATLRSFIEACNEVHQLIRTEKYLDRNSPKHHALVIRVLDCLDMSEIPKYARKISAGEALCVNMIETTAS